jgi:hypothetical protein
MNNWGISLIVKHVIYTHGSAERNRHSLPFLNIQINEKNNHS